LFSLPMFSHRWFGDVIRDTKIYLLYPYGRSDTL
jgi:hypothetical protein